MQPRRRFVRIACFVATVLFMTTVLLAPAVSADDKINASYINMAPAPFGSADSELTQSMAEGYAQSMFNRYIIMGLSFGQAVKCHCVDDVCQTCLEVDDPANPLYWGSKQPLNSKWKASSSSAVQVVQALDPKDHTKLFATLSGPAAETYLSDLSTTAMTADATACKKKPGTGNIHCAAFYLDRFVTAYGLDGLDIDLENATLNGTPSVAFQNLVAALGAYGWKHEISFSPYWDGSGGVLGRYIQGGSCALQNAEFTSYAVGRQYYAGGIEYDVLSALESDLRQAKTTVCEQEPKTTLDLGADQMVVGMSPYTVTGFKKRGGPPNCHYYYDDPDTVNCFDSVQQVVDQYPNVGGSFVWTASLIDAEYYACCMDQVLNDHEHDCGKPKPIARDHSTLPIVQTTCSRLKPQSTD